MVYMSLLNQQIHRRVNLKMIKLEKDNMVYRVQKDSDFHKELLAKDFKEVTEISEDTKAENKEDKKDKEIKSKKQK